MKCGTLICERCGQPVGFACGSTRTNVLSVCPTCKTPGELAEETKFQPHCDEIKQKRIDLKLTISHCADELGITAADISQIEHGRKLDMVGYEAYLDRMMYIRKEV